MEELQPFVERPADPQVSLSISGATFAWDKVPFNWCEKKCLCYYEKKKEKRDGETYQLVPS